MIAVLAMLAISLSPAISEGETIQTDTFKLETSAFAEVQEQTDSSGASRAVDQELVPGPVFSPKGFIETEGPDNSSFYFSDSDLLSRFVDTAIVSNPAIRQAESRWRAAFERISQERTLPDPMFSITQSDTPERMKETMFTLSQGFPWFGKLNLRGKIASLEALSLLQQAQVQIRDVVAEVKRAYYDLAYFDAALSITQQDKELLKSLSDMAAARYETGKGILQEVIKLDAEISKDDEQLYMLDQQRKSAAANLNTLMNRDTDVPIPSLARLSIPPVVFNLDQLYAKGRANLPELKAAEYMVERDIEAVRLARKEYFPDFNVSLSYTTVESAPPEMDDDGYDIMFEFNIPLWVGRRRAGVRAAVYDKRADEWEYQNVERKLEFSIRDAAWKAEALRDQLSLYDKLLIPQAEQALDSTQSAYQTGRLNALDLLDSERFLLQARLSYEKLKSDYMKALTDIERAIAAAFPDQMPLEK
jgi:outer membrane protein TolC